MNECSLRQFLEGKKMSDSPDEEIYGEFVKIDKAITGLRDRLCEMPQFSEKEIDEFIIPKFWQLRVAVGDVSKLITKRLTDVAIAKAFSGE
jgi:hypothetical protein